MKTYFHIFLGVSDSSALNSINNAYYSTFIAAVNSSFNSYVTTSFVSMTSDSGLEKDIGVRWTYISARNKLKLPLENDRYSQFNQTTVTASNKVFTVSTAEELNYVMDLCSSSTYSGYIVKLSADIDMKEYVWLPFNFYANFDGQGHTIRNLFSYAAMANGSYSNMYNWSGGFILSI